ncbi:mitochondrial import inner membrane translocase subunit TIM14-like isoform X2 [Artemia franciscana]|uniref:J domain-containing protein n=1 Tax=Artemia franciscana TaxID=6661 RepID=A0AA88IHN5_ARTSF|nr:hypothetical protein QYM36_007802 [Artemia franciscana]
MASSFVAAGLGLAAIGFIGRYVARNAPVMSSKMNEVVKNLPKLDLENFAAGSKYYKGGFEQKMTRREAALILGISPNAPSKRIKEAHKRIMLANHPDRGGSPYLAAKINEAKDIFDNTR